MEYLNKSRKQRGHLMDLRKNNFINNSSPFPEEIIRLVWKKAPVESRKDPRTWRRDEFGRFIKKEDYGKRKSRFGWEIDFIIPVIFGGTISIDNLRPLNWQNKKRRKRYA